MGLLLTRRHGYHHPSRCVPFQIPSKTSNHAMESTASGRYNLLFVSPEAYHVAMCLLARSDSSCSR